MEKMLYNGSAFTTYLREMKMLTGELESNVVESPNYYLFRGGAMPEWASYSIKEASQRSGYNEEYLRRLIRQGKLEAVKIGPAYLIRVESLERYVEEMQTADDGRTGPRPKSE
jgi:excisionase family DNA binding protein